MDPQRTRTGDQDVLQELDSLVDRHIPCSRNEAFPKGITLMI